MANKIGNNTQLLLWKESTRGTTPGTPVAHQMPLYDYSFGIYEETPQDIWELNGLPYSGQPGRGVIMADGTFTVPVDEVAIGIWLKLLLPTLAVAGAGDPYSHSYTVGTTTPDPFGLEIGDTVAAKYDVYPGCAVRGMELTVQKNPAKAQVTFDVAGLVAGAPTLEVGSSKDGTPATYTSDRYNAFGTIVKVGGSATTLIDRMTLRVRRELDMAHVLDGNRYPAHIGFGPLTVDGEISAIWDDADTVLGYAMTTAGAAGSEQSLEIDLIGVNANRDLKFYMDECAVYLPSAQGLGGRTLRRLTVAFKGYYQNDADAPIKAVLRNATADYTAIWTV